MKRTALAIASMAAIAFAPQAAAHSFTVRHLSDAHVGSSKAELIAQHRYSETIVRRLSHSWQVAPRHATCWSHVPWARTCDRARRRMLAHRWLSRLAERKLARLYPSAAPSPPSVPTSFYGQAECVHGYEGAWNDDTGNGFGGGLQFMVSTWNRAAAMSGGRVPYVASTGSIAAEPSSVQILAAYLIVSADGSWSEWPNTGRSCGLL